MNKEFFEALDLLEKEKGIPKEYMLGKVEAALITAFKRERGGSNVRVLIDENKKEVRVYEQMTVIGSVTSSTTVICSYTRTSFLFSSMRTRTLEPPRSRLNAVISAASTFPIMYSFGIPFSFSRSSSASKNSLFMF